MVDGADTEVTLELFERLLDLSELDVEVPQLSRVFVTQIRAQQVASFTSTGDTQLVFVQAEGERRRIDALLGLGKRDVNQPPGAPRLPARRTQLEQQLIAGDALCLKGVPRSRSSCSSVTVSCMCSREAMHGCTRSAPCASTPDEGDGMHQPLLRGEVTYQGKTYSGPGYCKRAWFDKDSECYAWRFIEGAFDDGNAMVWTADAFFGLNSYDYFKIAQADGTILVADNEHTHHRDNIGYGSIDGRPFEAEVEEIGQWQTRLLGGTFEALLRQRYSRLTVRYDGEEHKGYALHEMGGGMMR